MHRSVALRLAGAAMASFLPWVDGQQSGWAPNQVTATMCRWDGLRLAQLMDTAYIDGGDLWWTPGMADGGYGTPTSDGNPLGIIYTLNFSIPFNSSTNISNILGTLSKAASGGASNNLAPNYLDGALLANDHEFVLYGGLIRDTRKAPPQDADDVLGYQVSDYGLPKDFRPGFFGNRINDDITRYVTYGGAANAPSENKAWYIGGYRSPSGGPIYQVSGNDSTNPTNVSNTLITLDLSVGGGAETWSNDTLPSGFSGRANPSVVWVPVGEEGILVVLGGVSYPQYAGKYAVSLNEAQSEKESPSYMIDIDIYNIATKKWYKQPTTGAPGPLAKGCAVLATAQDSSSYNIYYYGGFDGIHATEDFNDDVWILSLPSFTWVKIYQGDDAAHGRAGHQCLTPYPDQMMSIGGYRAPKGTTLACLGSIVEVFNLTEGNWLPSYDPSIWSPYGVPKELHQKIGGDYSGGATLTTPAPSGWATSALASVFATTYPASKLTTYYPYSSQDAGAGERPPCCEGGGSKGGTPSWVWPVVGVILGLILVTAITVAVLLYRRRNLLKKNGRGENPGDEHHHFIRVWLNNTEKAPTVTTEVPSSRYEDVESRNEARTHPAYDISEMALNERVRENPRYELPDTSTIVELSGDATTHEIHSKHTQLYSPNSRHAKSPHSVPKSTSPPFPASVSQDRPSSLGSSSQALATATTGAASRERADSPTGGNPGPSREVVSSLSQISEQHMSHMRNLSGATVSSASDDAAEQPGPAQTGFVFGFDHDHDHDHDHGHDRPVSPPWPSPPIESGEPNGGDYPGPYQSMSPQALYENTTTNNNNNAQARLSVFRENSDDLGDSPTRGHMR